MKIKIIYSQHKASLSFVGQVLFSFTALGTVLAVVFNPY